MTHKNILQNLTLSITERYKYAIYFKDRFVSTTIAAIFVVVNGSRTDLGGGDGNDYF